MEKIHIGAMVLDFKTHKVTTKGDEFWLTFKDPPKNVLKVKVDESIFEEYAPGDPLDFHKDIVVQGKVD